MSQYQKGKTNLDFAEARDSEWQWHQLGRMQVCTSLQTDNYASTPPLSFLQAECPSCRPTNGIKALKAKALKAGKKQFQCMNTTITACCVLCACRCAVVDDRLGDLCSDDSVANSRLRTHRHYQHVPHQHRVSSTLTSLSTSLLQPLIGNESVPIQLAQCRFPGLAISNAKI